MNKRRVTLEDGRYLIFYTFNEDVDQRQPEVKQEQDNNNSTIESEGDSNV